MLNDSCRRGQHRLDKLPGHLTAARYAPSTMRRRPSQAMKMMDLCVADRLQRRKDTLVKRSEAGACTTSRRERRSSLGVRGSREGRLPLRRVSWGGAVLRRCGTIMTESGQRGQAVNRVLEQHKGFSESHVIYEVRQSPHPSGLVSYFGRAHVTRSEHGQGR